jgi:hypothetical protein
VVHIAVGFLAVGLVAVYLVVEEVVASLAVGEDVGSWDAVGDAAGDANFLTVADRQNAP